MWCALRGNWTVATEHASHSPRLIKTDLKETLRRVPSLFSPDSASFAWLHTVGQKEDPPMSGEEPRKKNSLGELAAWLSRYLY